MNNEVKGDEGDYDLYADFNINDPFLDLQTSSSKKRKKKKRNKKKVFSYVSILLVNFM